MDIVIRLGWHPQTVPFYAYTKLFRNTKKLSVLAIFDEGFPSYKQTYIHVILLDKIGHISVM